MSVSSRRDIRFWFRGRVVSITGIHPQTTVLRWLRNEQGLTGTKEGCGEGDCGACTVSLAALDPLSSRGLRFRAVNSCLLFLPALDGKALFTVEDLAQGDNLHPVQRALVDLHASQCGFCTPGFVMSLWSDYQQRSQRPTREEASAVLSGNLCRCTGYRPIVDAALAAWDLPKVEPPLETTKAALAEFSSLPSLKYGEGRAAWMAPMTVDELARCAEEQPESRLIAGATDLALRVTKGLSDLGPLISVLAVPELLGVETTDQGLRLGSALSLSDAFRTLTSQFAGLDDLAERFASVPVRNAGTLGGNLVNGSPIGDLPPVLLALEARLVLRRGKEVREVPLSDFYLGYQKNARRAGEVLIAILVPKLKPGALLRVWKVSKRRDQDISAVCGAFVLERDQESRVAQARLAYGGMAAIPRRANLAEAALRGHRFDEESLSRGREALSRDFEPVTDGRATAAYRMAVAQNLLTRLHGAWVGGAQ